MHAIGADLFVLSNYFLDVGKGDSCLFFFFQAEDGIRDHCVTGVQTCALPICTKPLMLFLEMISLLTAKGFVLMDLEAGRSEERRVGEEGRSRWSPYH